jgi:cytochrome b561
MNAAPLNLPAARRQPVPVMLMHWGTLAAIVLVVGFILIREGFDERALRSSLLGLHRSIGLLVFLAAIVRLALRGRYTLVSPPEMAPLTRLAAGATHVLLYALLLGLPLIGWALTNAGGHRAALFGFALPALIGPDEDLADLLGEVHEGAAWALFALVALHVAAALYHHFVRRDEVLVAMLPARLARRLRASPPVAAS